MFINPLQNDQKGSDSSLLTELGLDFNSVNTTTLIPFGGCGEFGRNLTALITRKNLFIIDCGILFTDGTQPGVSGVFYDINPLITQVGKPVSYLITHAHRDHIGALIYFLNRWPANVYGTEWTISYITSDLEKNNIEHLKTYLKPIKKNEPFQTGAINCEFISVNHSIPETCSLFIKTPDHLIAHTGDFKIDPKCTLESPADLKRWSEIASTNKIDVMLCDSTNAGIQGHSLSEDLTTSALYDHIKSATGRIFITTFSSNLWRLINTIEAAKKAQKKVVVLGYGMNQTLDIAQKLGLYQADPQLVDTWCLDQSNSNTHHKVNQQLTANYSNCNHVFLISGSQLEPRSVLSRIINKTYPGIEFKSSDRVIFSSRTIPGYEKNLIKAKGEIIWQGAEVITTELDPNIHVSGHGYDGDIDLLLSIIKPRYFIPIHGELVNLINNVKSRKNQPCFIWKNLSGCMLYKNNIYAYELEDNYQELYIDTSSNLIIDKAILKDRKKLGSQGMIIVSCLYDPILNRFISPVNWQLKATAIDEQFIADHSLNQLLQSLIEDYIIKKIDTDFYLISKDATQYEYHIDCINQLLRSKIRNYIAKIFGIKPNVIINCWINIPKVMN